MSAPIDRPIAITVVGAGVVGTNLASAWARLGHRITFGARDPASDKVRAALDLVPATAVPLAESTDGAELVALAVPYAAVADTVAALGSLDRAVLVDATNPVGSALPDGDTTVVDQIRRLRPDASVVKAFNTIGAEAYLDPVIGGRPAFLPIAGDEAGSRLVQGLASAMGFDARVIGGDEQVRLLEDFAQLWIHLAFGAGFGRGFGFAIVER